MTTYRPSDGAKFERSISMSQSDYHALDADIIIVGAGLAGMTAAYALIEKEPSLNIIILEAKNRIGGRISSKPVIVKNGEFCMFDFGGQWINSQQHVLLNLMAKLDILTATRHEGGKIIIDYNRRQHKENKDNPYRFCTFSAKLELADFVRKFEIMCKRPSIATDLASETMDAFIERNLSHETNKAIVKSLILRNLGVDAANVSVGFYVFFCTSTHGITNQLTIDCDGMREMWIQQGAQEICNKMAILLQRDVEIKTATKVLEITSHASNVEVTTFAGKLYSRKVVVAVSPSQISQMKFWPPLPEEKVAAINNVLRGDLTKFIVTYEEAFWRKMGYSGDIYVLSGYDPEEPLLCCFETSVENKPALTGYLVQHEGTTKYVCMLQLARYFGRKALQPLYCGSKFWKYGSPMCCFTSAEDVYYYSQKNDGLYWAGAETSIEWYGSMCGAVLSGYRTANDILYDIHPSILSVADMADMDLFQSDLSTVRERNRSHADILKKLVNPYYQISALLLIIIGTVIVWRKVGITARLKNFLIKK